MGKFIITEEEKKHIKGLYEQPNLKRIKDFDFQLEAEELGKAITKKLSNDPISASETTNNGDDIPGTYTSFFVKGFNYVSQPTKVKSKYLIPFIYLGLDCNMIPPTDPNQGKAMSYPTILTLNISMKNGYPSGIISATSDRSSRVTSFDESEISKRVLPLIKNIRI
jgi:hypothetical protein